MKKYLNLSEGVFLNLSTIVSAQYRLNEEGRQYMTVSFAISDPSGKLITRDYYEDDARLIRDALMCRV